MLRIRDPLALEISLLLREPLYRVTRTIGIPYIGPEAGTIESAGLLDVTSKLLELALIACLVLILRPSWPSRPTAADRS